MTETLIHLLRHGEPEGGRAYRGHGVDDPLSETGWQQMRQALPFRVHWDVVVTSPLLRCRAFAEEVAGQAACPVQILESFKEIGFGEWEGRTPDDLLRIDPEGLDAYRRDPVNCRPRGAEPLQVFRRRIDEAWHQLLQAYSGRQVLVVAHAGVMRAVTACVLALDHQAMQSIRIDYAHWLKIRHDAGRNTLLCVNSPVWQVP